MQLTDEDRQRWRQAYLNEPGTEPPCPLCNQPRVRRSDYIRCNRDGVNWLDGEDISKDPRIERYAEMLRRMQSTAPSKPETNTGAQTAVATTTKPPVSVTADKSRNSSIA